MPRPHACLPVRALIAFLALASPVAAATFVVDETADGFDAAPGDGACATVVGTCTFRAALEEAAALPGSHRIDVPAGTYELTLTGASMPLELPSGILIVGAGAESTVIQQESWLRGQAGSARLVGLTLRGGQRGLDVDGAAVRVSDCVLTEAQPLGAVLLRRGSLSLVRTEVSDGYGSSSEGGGGITVHEGSLRVDDSLIRGNGGPWSGSGLVMLGGTATITRTRFEDNCGNLLGGLFVTGADLTLEDVVLDHQSCWMMGGLIEDSTARISRSTVEGLIVDDSDVVLESSSIGGTELHGLEVHGGELTARDSVIESLWADSASVALVRCEVSRGLDWDPEACELRGGTAMLSSTTLAPGTNLGLYAGVSAELWNTTLSQSHVRLRDGSSLNALGSTLDGIVDVGPVSFFLAWQSILRSCEGNVQLNDAVLIEDPGDCLFSGSVSSILAGVDPLLAPLADNGGPTRTMALLPGSPALDAGEGPLLDVDQRGVRRPQDADGDGDAANDLGAFEACEGVDEDGDLVPEPCDACPGLADDQRDEDGDGVGDACDVCPSVADPDQEDADDDGFGDACDACPLDAEVVQRDCDRDGLGDVCDLEDTDGDGLVGGDDNCACRSNPDQADGDGDGLGDDCDPCPDAPTVEFRDSDQDGVPDECDPCPHDIEFIALDSDGDGVGDVCDNCPELDDPDTSDSDADGVGDPCDNCPLVPNPGQEDSDGDGVGDACIPCPEPSPLDMAPGAPPLTMSHLGGGVLSLTWQAVPVDAFNVYRGTLAVLRNGSYDHASLGACGLGEASVTLSAGSGSSYFLVTSACASVESSFGRDSGGDERPSAMVSCP